MKKIIVSEFVTIDDVFEDPGGSENFKYGGWSLEYFSDEYGKFKFDELLESDTLLLGRKTYEGFAEAWPDRTGEFADIINSLPKYVVSTTLQKLDWNNSHLIKGDVVEGIKKLKTGSGKAIGVHGSGQLVRTLIKNDLVDELRLMVHPVVLGTGHRLFDGADRKRFKLADIKKFKTGTVVLTYRPGHKSKALKD